MDIKKEKEEDPLSNDVVSQNMGEFPTIFFKMKTNNDPEDAIKTECKSRTPSPDLCLLKQMDIDDPIMNEKKYKDQELLEKIEIKDETWWQEPQMPSVFDDDDADNKDGDIPPKNSKRLSAVDTPVKLNHPELSETRRSKKEETTIKRGETPHKCQQCGMMFKRKSNLKSHQFVHSDKKPYQCKLCKSSYIRSTSLKIHYLNHEGKKPHECETCGKGFNHFFNMKRHTLTHEGKKPFQCKICAGSFTQLTSLKNHSLIHEGKRQHRCNVCNKSFKLLSYLKSHQWIHENDKPYKCNECNKSFTLFRHLRRHFQSNKSH